MKIGTAWRSRGKVILLELAREDEGQTLIIAALSLLVLLGFVAFAADVGMLLHQKRLMQTAADSAAIAGAAQLGNSASKPGGGTTHCNTSNDNCWYYAAIADAVQNGATSSSVTPHNPPSLGPNTGSNGYVEVIISQTYPTFFMRALGFSSMSVAARAVAMNTPPANCVYTLDTTGDDVSASGNAGLSIPKCGIVDESASTGKTPAMSTNGNASITASSIEIVGSDSPGKSGSISPTPTTVSASSVGNPLSYLTAPTGYPACVAQPSGSTLGPVVSGGMVCYNGLSFGPGTYTMNPGTYIIKGGFSESGNAVVNATGGVTIYMLTGGLSLGGNTQLNLTAPTSGTYAGIGYYQDSSDTSSISFSGTGGGTFNGIIYAPTAPMSLGGTSGGTLNTDLVVGSLSVSGDATINEYVPLYGGPLTTPTLVE